MSYYLKLKTSPAVAGYIWKLMCWRKELGVWIWKLYASGKTTSDGTNTIDVTEPGRNYHYKYVGTEQTVGGKTYFYCESAWFWYEGLPKDATLTLVEKLPGNQPPPIPTPVDPPPTFVWGAMIKDAKTGVIISGASVILHTPDGDKALLTDVDGYAGEWMIHWGAGRYGWRVSKTGYLTEDLKVYVAASGSLLAALRKSTYGAMCKATVKGRCTAGYPTPSMLLEVYGEGAKKAEGTILPADLVVGQTYNLAWPIPADINQIRGRMVLTNILGSYEFTTSEGQVAIILYKLIKTVYVTLEEEWKFHHDYRGYDVEFNAETGMYRWLVQFYYLQYPSAAEADASIDRWRAFVGTEAEFFASEGQTYPY